MRFLKSHNVIASLLLCFLVLTPGITYAGFIEQTLWDIVAAVFGSLVGLAALILNAGINEFVIGFGENYATSGVGVAVDSVWVVIRDFMNMAFIFGLLYIGFKIILNSDDSNTRAMLARLIIAALLVNFSLFITKLTVDVSNSIASEIALNGFLTEEEETPRGTRTYVDMGGDLLARMGVASIFDVSEDSKLPTNQGFWYIFGSAIFMLITAFVFAAGGILLIIRYAILNLYMVLSPLMFIGWAFPPLAKLTSDYWEGFLKRAFFAPVYFLLVYFSLHILSEFQTSLNLGGTGDDGLNGVLTGSGTEIGNAASSVLPFFLLCCIFMISALVISSKIGADGASQAVNIGKSLANKTNRFARKHAGGVALRGAQRGGAELQRRYNRLDASLAKTRGGRFARGVVNTATLGLTSDKSMQTGFSSLAGARIAGSETYTEQQKRSRETQKRRNQTEDVVEREKKFYGAYNNLNDKLAEIDNTEDGEGIMIGDQARLVMGDSGRASLKEEAKKYYGSEMENTLKKMSQEEVEDLVTRSASDHNMRDVVKNENVAKYLSDAQLKGLKDSGILDNREKKEMDEMWAQGKFGKVEVLEKSNATLSELQDTIKDLRSSIKSLSKEQLGNMDLSWLKKEGIAVSLSEKDLDTLKDSGNFTQTQLDEIKDIRTTAMEKIAQEGTFINVNNIPAAADTDFQREQRQDLFKGSTADVGKHPVKIFKHAGAYEFVNPEIITQRMKNGISNTDKVEMRNALESYLNDPNTPTGTRQVWDKWKNGNSTHAAQFFS